VERGFAVRVFELWSYRNSSGSETVEIRTQYTDNQAPTGGDHGLPALRFRFSVHVYHKAGRTSNGHVALDAIVLVEECLDSRSNFDTSIVALTRRRRLLFENGDVVTVMLEHDATHESGNGATNLWSG
jgi:hypothetical protein